MRIEKANNLEVNFVSRDYVGAKPNLPLDKLWLMEADAVVDTWRSSDGETIVRTYASGWQEIRGWRNGAGQSTVTYPFPFADLHVFISFCCGGGGYAYYSNNTTTGFTLNTSGTPNGVIWWSAGQKA
jgi:hypothetical protein